MKNSNLIQILKTFSTGEIKEFGEFVRSGFFNKNESVIKLYDYLRKYHPDYEENRIAKEEIHRKIFAGTKYNDAFIRKIIFNLTHLAESYITYNNSVQDPVDSGITLLAELNKRKLEKLFTKHFTEIEKENEVSGLKNHVYYRRKFALEAQWSNYSDNMRYKVDLHDKKEYHNERTGEKLTHFVNYFLFHSMDTYRTLKYQGYVDRFEYNDELLDNVIEYLLKELHESGTDGKSKYTGKLTLRVYLYEIMLMRDKSGVERLASDIYFLKLKDMLRNGSENLLHDSRFSLYNILLQHCANRIMRGFSEYRTERFVLDKIALEQKIYMSRVETEFPPPAFASIVRDACEMKEFEWARAFIEKNKGSLEQTNFETVLNLSYAIVFFNEKDFMRSLEYLNKIKPVKRWEFKSAVKEMTMQVFYELSMFEQAYYLVDSFRHFQSSMSRNFSIDRIESRTNYLKFYTRLLRIKEDPDNTELENILNGLNNNSILIFNRDWLREKAEELKLK
ncbi:MAG: hypothetical protein ABI543_11460 [Ignavibacteria bacterium]